MGWFSYSGQAAIDFIERLKEGQISQEDRLAVTELDLSWSGLKELPECVTELENLMTLNLSYTLLESLPSSIERLKKLTFIDLMSSTVTALPESIGQLQRLTNLSLNYTQIRTLPESIGRLRRLRTLILSNSQIEALPESIAELPELSVLHLTGCKNLSCLPAGMEKLTRLTRLKLSEIQLKELPPALVLSWVRRGMGFTDYDNAPAGMILHHTGLLNQNIELFLSNDKERIFAYCEAALTPSQDRPRKCNEGRIVFLGDGDGGKTYTIKRILQNEAIAAGLYTEATAPEIRTRETPGVDISLWRPYDTPFTFKIWDFGGQEILHSFHRCFLRDQCLYVVVLRQRTADSSLTGQAKLWLRTIQSYAPNSTVLLAVNVDEGIAIGESGILMESLRREFPELLEENAKALVYCAKREPEDGFDALQEAILQKAGQLESVERELSPGEWQVKTALENMQSPVISGEEYRRICQAAGIEGLNQNNHLDWLTNLGVCFRYEKDDDRRVLDPEWITQAVYGLARQIQAHKEALAEEARQKLYLDGYANANGIIAQSRILPLLQDETAAQEQDGGSARHYEKEHIPYILQILRQHQLSFPVNEEGFEFFPALCPEEPREELHPGVYLKKLELVREYGLIPGSAIAALMVACSQYLCKEQCYLRSFTLRDKGFFTVVEFTAPPLITTVKITVYVLEGNLLPGTFLRYLQTRLEEKPLGELKRELLYFEPDAHGRYEVDMAYYEAAKKANMPLVPAKNCTTGMGEFVPLEDISGEIRYDKTDALLQELMKKQDRLQEQLNQEEEAQQQFRREVLEKVRELDPAAAAELEAEKEPEKFGAKLARLIRGVKDSPLTRVLIELGSDYVSKNGFSFPNFPSLPS